MFKTSPNSAISKIEVAYKAKQPIFIWGSPGIGKSDSVRKAADNLGIGLTDVRASQLDAVDLNS